MNKESILALCGYLSVATQQRLAKDSSLCPTMLGQMELAQFSALSWENYTRVQELADEFGVDLIGEMGAFGALTLGLEKRLRPSDWYERLTKSYVTVGLWKDFLDLLLQAVEKQDAKALATLEPVQWDCGSLQWAGPIIATWASEPTIESRLSLWGRRVAGDVMSTLSAAALPYPDLMGLEASQVEEMAQELRVRHAIRMEQAGLIP